MKNKADEDDKTDLKKLVYVAVGVAAVGGLLFGYDTGVISGAILFIKKQFSLSDTMQEIVVSSVLVGAVIGAVTGGALSDRYGRRKLIIVAGIVFSLSAIGAALAPSVGWLITARVISGVGIGMASFISPMYIGELSPAKIRGALVAVNMLAITTGIVVSYFIDYAYSGSGQWRYMLGLAVIPSAVLVIGMWLLPDSPRWLVSKSKTDEAKKVLKKFRKGDVNDEINSIQKITEKKGNTDLGALLEPSVRMPMIVGMGFAIFQQITGINTVMYYSPTIFKYAGIHGTGSSILAGAALAGLMWLMHILSILLLDRVGRRPLLLIGVAGQIIGLAILGAAFQFQQLANIKAYVATGGLAIYVACFAFGLGPIFWLMISEIYPLRIRAKAMSAVTVTNWAMNLLVSVTFLSLVDLLGQAETFWLYGVIAIGAWIFFYKLIPETKGKSLEAIEAQWEDKKD